MESLFHFFDEVLVLEAPEKESLATLVTLRKYKKHEDIQTIGATCKNIYFIAKGIARIYYYKDGLDITEQFSFENQLVVRAESLFNATPSRKGIQALEHTEIWSIPAPALFAIYDSHPRIERLFRLIFEQQHVLSIQRLESLQFHTAEERYQQLIIDHKHIVQRIPQKYIASYLGITPVSLSRIRSKIS
jgi:CRP-like cAMP-binding protein